MIKAFLYKIRWNCLTFAALLILQTVLLDLYGIDKEPIFYLFILEVFFFGVSNIISFLIFRKKYATLLAMENHIFESMEMLPDFSSPMEQKLRLLLLEYDKEYRKHLNEIMIQKQEMADYYVLWTHQIKTPITSIGLLLQSQDHPQNAELNAELFRIEQYVQMALGYLRINDMHNDLLIQMVRVDDCVKSALKKYAKEFIRRKLSVSYTQLDWNIMTDEKWIIFVIEQVLSNALKYTKTGEISIYRKEDALVICDTGIGIRKEDLPRIFDKGFTGYNGRADKKSTGIGLYLCARVMSNLSLRIRADSKLGEGTLIYLYLVPDKAE